LAISGASISKRKTFSEHCSFLTILFIIPLFGLQFGCKGTKIKPKSKRNHHILLLFDIIHDVEETLIIQ
jgi:hypothetical protein